MKEPISDAKLEDMMEQMCNCKSKDVNFWYIRDDKDRKSIQCRGCQTCISEVK